MKKPVFTTVTLDKIVGGGQALGTMADGRKLFAWGGLPGETVAIQLTKKKSSYAEGIVTEVEKASSERIQPKDPESYLSTSPWQIMTFKAEQHYKAALIEEAFELHDIVLPQPIEVYSDGNEYSYRNKIEFSFWFDTGTEKLSLAFFRRGTHGKIPVAGTSLAAAAINEAAQHVTAVLNKHHIIGRALKTLLIRCDQQGNVAWQLYVKDEDFPIDLLEECRTPSLVNAEIIYSDPRSPASVITKRLANLNQTVLSDTLLGVPFSYATEGFFQINLPVYTQALKDMQEWITENTPVLDLYSGVGSIGLTIGGNNVTLIEVNEHAVREMRRNIAALGRENEAKAVLAASEQALEHLTPGATIIVDPPRAGLHEDVTDKLLEAAPERIIYLSCNPVTQARDIARLAEKYGVRHHRGYNFFPRTPHIEHLVILERKG